ncbi:MAG: 4-hydroxythreonine-4-phosphate dehydrogenase [Phycisphaerae bacterium]|nr:MAG: 4-hydroxythreonine-4-phosphate dehydrogenase [Phycisphaerae bacterium]
MTPTIAVSMGDPGGIGPEVLVKALADQSLRLRARFAVYGLDSCLRRAAEAAAIRPYWTSLAPGLPLPDGPGVFCWNAEQQSGHASPAFESKDSAEGGRLSLAWLEAAVQLCKPGRHASQTAHALVTGPISKASWALAGEVTHPGHTGLLAARFGVTRYAMMFVSPLLRVILASDHLALRHVPRAITAWHVRDIIELGHAACRRLGISAPRIAVCGLNPHAGERGLLGAEDDEDIRPAIDQARAKGIDAQGPFPADTIFLDAIDRPNHPRRFDLVVAMYHDQGLIPVKLLARDSAVNITVGLPVPRTSPDHGTAFDIAGKNLAHPGSMTAALALAVQMAQPGALP